MPHVALQIPETVTLNKQGMRPLDIIVAEHRGNRFDNLYHVGMQHAYDQTTSIVDLATSPYHTIMGTSADLAHWLADQEFPNSQAVQDQLRQILGTDVADTSLGARIMIQTPLPTLSSVSYPDSHGYHEMQRFHADEDAVTVPANIAGWVHYHHPESGIIFLQSRTNSPPFKSHRIIGTPDAVHSWLQDHIMPTIYERMAELQAQEDAVSGLLLRDVQTTGRRITSGQELLQYAD